MKVFIPIFSIFLISDGVYAQVPQKEHIEWIDSFNNRSAGLNELYHPKAVLITPDFKAVAGASAAEVYQDLQKSSAAIELVKTVKRIAAGPAIDYEVVEMEAANGDLLKQLIVWNKAGNLPLRELEATFVAERQVAGDPGIDEARKKWMELCNKNMPAELVAQVYTPNAIYYNHKPVVSGTAAISREYAYMANPNYTLQLTPIHVEMVKPELAFELGQCSGSYGGKYLIVWVKSEKGNWQVALDSNI